jgi:hypothetical protein
MTTLKRNEFRRFVSTRDFSLAAPMGTQWLPTGTALETDGYSVRCNGETWVHPQIRGAIAVGWLVEREAEG